MRKNTPFLSPLTGGGHESNRRPGTENVPYIVGIARALALVDEKRATENPRQAGLRDKLINGVLDNIPGSQLTGHPTGRLPNNASFVFEGCEADAILMHLDLAGIQAASGSACTTGMPEPSHVLVAMNLPYELSLGALRLSLGRQTHEEDINFVLERLPDIIQRIRKFNDE
jgi:cysteine desulfurase